MQQRFIFKLTNELFTISRMIGFNEVYNPNIDIIDKIFYDYFAKDRSLSAELYHELEDICTQIFFSSDRVCTHFQATWKRFVRERSKDLQIKRREYELFFSQQNIIPHDVSPSDVRAAYDLLYTELIKFIHNEFKITAIKANVGLTYDSDIDLSQELNHFVIYNAHKIFKKLKKTEKNARLKHKSDYQNQETLHHLGTSKDWIDFECDFRKIETKVCSILDEWNRKTKYSPDLIAILSKRTKWEIIKFFQDTFPGVQVHTRQLWKKIITLNSRRPLSISYQPLHTLIKILERYPEKRIREKQEALKARTSFFTDDITFTQ